MDYLDDKRCIVPLDDMSKQSSKYVLKATFYKLKADYYRYIFECLHGDNGIFFNDPRQPRENVMGQTFYNAYMAKRKGDEISVNFIQADLKEDDLKCELCDVDFY